MTGTSYKRLVAWCRLPDGCRAGVAVRWDRFDPEHRLDRSGGPDWNWRPIGLQPRADAADYRDGLKLTALVFWMPSRRTNRGDNSHDGNRCDGSGGGNGRDEADRAARAGGSDKRRYRSDSCVGIRSD